MAETNAKPLANPAHNTDDEILVKKFNQGDDSAFDRIVAKYSADIAVLANRLLGWSDDAEDVVQDIFLAAFLGLKKFRGDCSLKTWLFKITINKCRTYRYQRIFRLKFLLKSAGHIGTVPSVDKTIMDNETFDCIRRVIMTLPAKYREPIVLTYLQQLPTDDICQTLGISKNLLHVRLNRAKQHLKNNLAEFIKE
ncbi:MAG: RNA polymerase sigma factor [Planctomycetota bacterium]|jgi:RNA polymerase sigma-70 factor (ECF subfamily)